MPQSSSKVDAFVKWGGAAVFIAVVAISGWYIYDASRPVESGTTAVQLSGTASPAVLTNGGAETAQAPVVSPSLSTAMPAKVTAPADLDSADKELDASDISTVTSDLNANETDLASF